MPAYRQSPALRSWLSVRHSNVAELMRARVIIDGTRRRTTAGTPSKPGPQQLDDALVLRLVTEFQGFVRDLLFEAMSKMIEGSGCLEQYRYQILSAAMEHRMIDRGNPRLDAIAADASRLGISHLRSRMEANNTRHAADAAALANLVELRNALVHDDRDKVLELSQIGVRSTYSYGRRAWAVIDRHARALDHVVWDHLASVFPGVDPWR